MFVSTLNKTLKSYFFAIVGAEYILRWLPIGTHDWEKFIEPSKLVKIAKNNSLYVKKNNGVKYIPILDEWKISKVDANASKEEGLTMLAQRYCAAYPFAQLEDFAWWTKIAPGKIKKAFIEAKTQWRQQEQDQEEMFGLYLLPYRDMLSEGTRYYEKAWGLNVEPHPRAPGALPTVILDGQVIGHWTTQNAQVVLHEDVEHLCQEEEAALHRHKEDLAHHLLFRFTDLLPVYDIYE